MDLEKEAMKCGVEMEIHAALSTTTQSKGKVISRYLRAAYEAGARGDALEQGSYAASLAE